MSFIDVTVQKAFTELTGQNMETIEIDLNDEVLKELKKFDLQETPLSIQDHFISLWYHLKKLYIDVIGWERIGYEIRYIFKRENQTAALKFWVNSKNEFKSNYQKLPANTNSDQLFKSISNALEKSSEIIINRNTAEAVLNKVSFDSKLEESKPFLKYLFDSIKNNLNSDEFISSITHLNYRERYTIEKGSRTCVFDFEYDKKGFFGRVLPLQAKCNSQKISDNIKEIVNNLKRIDHAI